MKSLFNNLKKVLVFVLIIPVMFVFSACGKKKDKTPDNPSGGIEQPLPDGPETPGGEDDDDGDDPVVPEVKEDNFSVILNYDLPNYISDLLPAETKTAKVNVGYALPTFVGTEYESFFEGWYTSDNLNEDSKIETESVTGEKDSTISVYAKWNEGDIENYFYTDGLEFDFYDDDNTATVKSYPTDAENEIVVIPQAVKVDTKTYFVDKIGEGAFKDTKIKELRTYLRDYRVLSDAFNNSPLEKIEFEKVLSVGANAFKGTNLKTVNFSNKLVNLASSAFENCTQLESVDMSNVGGNSFTTLPARAFFGCSKLSTIHLSLSTTEIGVSAFEGCSSLENLNFIRDSYVTSLSNRVFAGCTSLDKIEIPEKIVSYGTQMFDGSNVSEITLTYLLTDAGYTNVKFSTFFGDLSLSLKKLTIVGNKTTAIEKSYFSDYSELTDFVMNNSITEIGSSAFYGCSSLTNITFSTALYGGGIKIDAFLGSAWYANLNNEDDCVINNTLVYVSDNFEGYYEVPDGVTYIGNRVFKNKSKITSVLIPASVETISSSAFESATISSVIIDDQNRNYGVISGTMKALSGSETISYSALYKLNASGDKIELISYFADKNGGVLVIPSTVLKINDTSFDIAYYPTYVYVQSEGSQIILDSYSNVSYVLGIENITIKNNKNLVSIYKYLPQTSGSGDNYRNDLIIDGDEIYADFGFAALTGLNFIKINYNSTNYYYLVNHSLKTVQKIELDI